uniref:Endoglucanase n=1 Tax=Pomacea maculata TaxID=1245466 RepID=A0SGJ6_POMMA|nr:endo-beta-1,4-glucanase [Ampullaria crossean]
MFSLVLWAVLPLLGFGSITVPVNNHWAGGFQARVCFNIDKDMSSWVIHLAFDQPVQTLDVWTANAQSTSADKKEWSLTNKEWNAVEHVGDELCIDLMGHGDGDIAPVITATLEGAEGGGSHQVITSAPRTTVNLPPGVTTAEPQPTAPLTVPDGNGFPATTRVANVRDGLSEQWLTFTITGPTVMGWVVKFRCNKPVTNLHVADADALSHNEDMTEWLLVNNDNKIALKAGTLEMKIEVKLVNVQDSAPQCSAILINMGVDNYTCGELPNKANSKYNYDDVLYKSILFYEAQRSGKLPANNRIPWRGDSALNDGDGGVDLTGGWYDAGDFVKFNFPMAWSTAILNWGLLQFKDAYEAAGQLEWMYESVKWPLDYLLKCHSSDDVLYVQVGDGGADHGSWGRPEDMKMARPAFKVDASRPGSEVAMETAVAFVTGHLAFKEKDPPYSAKLLQHAKSLWEFAVTHKGKYSESVSAAASYYNSVNVTDELCWGSLWLYKATKEPKYLEEALKHYDASPDWGMSWDDVFIGNQVLLYELTKEEKYKAAVEGTFKEWFPGGTVPYTPKGLAYRLQWGALRYSSNMAMAALMAAEAGIHPDEYRHWAMCQIHYALGDTGRSFVVGFGKNPPVSPHHRSSSCPNLPVRCNMNYLHLDTPNTHMLCGALVGGPDSSDGYKDSRENYVNNEVACDYNAGFQTAVAGLRSLLLRNLHPEQKGSATCPYHGAAP